MYTFEFEGMLCHVLLEICTFEDIDSKTKLTEKCRMNSNPARTCWSPVVVV